MYPAAASTKVGLSSAMAMRRAFAVLIRAAYGSGRAWGIGAFLRAA
jgi:hypothetical protein